MIVHHREILLPPIQPGGSALRHFAQGVGEYLPEGSVPLRFAVSKFDGAGFHCEVAAIEDLDRASTRTPESIFRFRRREVESAAAFTAVLVVPTGVGAEIGGHAGDAAPVAKLIAAVCDRLVTHPNVVNASDINEMPSNGLYVEGSVICRLLMGTVGLQPVRSNRVLVILDSHEDRDFVDAAINSVSAARASYGFDCPRVVVLDPPITMIARYTAAGCAVGDVEGLDRICRVLDMYQGQFDAVAISSVIDVPPSFHMEYFKSEGRMVNPWGGVEAILTHAVSSLYDIPSAHSPMLESEDVADEEPGVVDPRMAAEAVSLTFLQCILKGLQRSPRILPLGEAAFRVGMITAADVSCLIIPDGCLGLPTIAALEQGITVIAVRENRNLMHNNLSDLPWPPGQFYLVENYWEAAGIVAALRAGIAPSSTRRPLQGTNVARLALRDQAAAAPSRSRSRAAKKPRS